MIDLSNNNAAVDFHAAYRDGQRRVYLKRSEGTRFIDPTFDGYRRDALAAGFKVGAYHFARPSRNTPAEEAGFFLRHAPLLEKGRSLHHALDLEDPDITPSWRVGSWATEFMDIVYRATGHWRVILYSYVSYLDGCRFPQRPNSCKGLWIAAYGNNDGREHLYTLPSEPWQSSEILAHQYTSRGRVPGVEGYVDISRPYHPGLIDVT